MWRPYIDRSAKIAAEAGAFVGSDAHTCNCQTIMNRANIAAVLGVAMLSAARVADLTVLNTRDPDTSRIVPGAFPGSSCRRSPCSAGSRARAD